MGWNFGYGTTQSGRHKTYSRPAGPISGFFMVLAGIALLGGAGWTGKNTYALVTEGIHAAGKVVDVKQSLEKSTRHTNGHTRHVEKMKYRYTVEFNDKAGKLIRFQDSMSTDTQKYSVGDAIPVIFLEKEPRETATVDHGMMNWILPGALGLFGVVLCLSGGAAMLRRPGMA